MTVLAGLLALALLGQSPTHTYYWRDAAGQTHITNTPPPPGAEVLEVPPPTAVEPGKADSHGGVRPDPQGPLQGQLSPVEQQAWKALDERLARARTEGDSRTLATVTDSLISNGLWGHGLWVMAAAPALALTLMGLLGWWLALGLRSGLRAPLVVGFLVLGLALGQLVLSLLLYQPQARRVHQNLELLERHLGTGRDLRPDQRMLLQQRYRTLEQSALPLQPPWRFPRAVQTLRATMRQVMVES